MTRRKWFFGIGTTTLALALGTLGLNAANSDTTEGCCCITNDQGQLVCTITNEVLEECCCN